MRPVWERKAETEGEREKRKELRGRVGRGREGEGGEERVWRREGGRRTEVPSTSFDFPGV